MNKTQSSHVHNDTQDEPASILIFSSALDADGAHVWSHVRNMALDEEFRDDILQSLKIIGPLFKVHKGVLDYRHRQYIKKIAYFIFELQNISTEEKQKLDNKLTHNPLEFQKAGETVLEILDKMIGTEKASMLAKLFRAHLNENIPLDDFLYYAEILSETKLLDIQLVLDTSLTTKNSQGLINSGIVQLFDMDVIYKEISKAQGFALRTGGSGHVSYTPTLTPAGQEIRRILKTY